MNALLRDADIFVENHFPMTMRNLSLDKETNTNRHRHCIFCPMKSMGVIHKKNTPAFNVNNQAAYGMTEMTGTAQSGPTRTGAPILDYSTAIAAAFAISATLFERTKSGNGSFIHVSML